MSLTVFKLILCVEVTLYTVVVVRKIMVSESKIIFWFSLEAPFTSLLDQGYGSHITCSDPLDILFILDHSYNTCLKCNTIRMCLFFCKVIA